MNERTDRDGYKQGSNFPLVREKVERRALLPPLHLPHPPPRLAVQRSLTGPICITGLPRGPPLRTEGFFMPCWPLPT